MGPSVDVVRVACVQRGDLICIANARRCSGPGRVSLCGGASLRVLCMHSCAKLCAYGDVALEDGLWHMGGGGGERHLGEGLCVVLRLSRLAVLAEGGGARRQCGAAAEALEGDLRKAHEAADGRGGRAHVDRACVLPCNRARRECLASDWHEALPASCEKMAGSEQAAPRR